MRKCGKTEYILKYETIRNNLRKALNEKAWDGKWYKRAFMDDGNTLGCKENDECKIDSIAQSWAAISGAGDEEKVDMGMESLENYLIDKETRNYQATRPAI